MQVHLVHCFNSQVHSAVDYLDPRNKAQFENVRTPTVGARLVFLEILGTVSPQSDWENLVILELGFLFKYLHQYARILLEGKIVTINDGAWCNSSQGAGAVRVMCLSW